MLCLLCLCLGVEEVGPFVLLLIKGTYPIKILGGLFQIVFSNCFLLASGNKPDSADPLSVPFTIVFRFIELSLGFHGQF